jgi:hypothetical protein
MHEPTVTASQAFLGTLRYAAPEWLFAEACTTASDIYSLGAVFYSLLTGQPLFSHISLYSRLVVAVKESSPWIPGFNPVPQLVFLADLAERMLLKSPRQRPELQEVISTLEEHLATTATGEQQRWKQSHAGLGIVVDSEELQLQIWRGTSDLDGFIALSDAARATVAGLVRLVRELRDRSSIASVSAMILKTPGSGSSYLVQRVARKMNMMLLQFNLTQLANRDEVASLFESIESAQSRCAEPLLVVVDEFSAHLNAKNVYDLFRSAVRSGSYTKKGWDHVRSIRPAVWLFADKRPSATEYKGLEPILTHGCFDLIKSIDPRENPSEPLVRTESVYIGASLLRTYFPGVTQASVDVLKAFYSIEPSSRGRRLRRLIVSLSNVQYGRVTSDNLYAFDGAYSESIGATVSCPYSGDDLVRIVS